MKFWEKMKLKKRKKKSHSNGKTFNRKISTNNTIVFIDYIFLLKAIYDTKKIYSKIYPNRTFNKILISSLVQYLIELAENWGKNIVDIYVITADEYPLDEDVISMDVKEIDIENDSIPIHQINCDFISFQIEELAKTNTIQNIILFADDSAYSPILSSWQESAIDIILIKFSEESRMPPKIKYYDINYLLGRCMGLDQHEL